MFDLLTTLDNLFNALQIVEIATPDTNQPKKEV